MVKIAILFFVSCRRNRSGIGPSRTNRMQSRAQAQRAGDGHQHRERGNDDQQDTDR